MKFFTPYLLIATIISSSLDLMAQDFNPEQYKTKSQHYVAKKADQVVDPYTFKMDPMDEILFSEDFADSLTGNNGFGPWTRTGQHALIWRWDFDGPDGPLIENGAPIASTTFDNGFFIFDADAADPAMIGGIERIGFLVSPEMDLSAAGSTILQFQQFFNYCCYDFTPLYVGVSNDGGSTWIDLSATPGYNGGANNFSANPMLTNIDISPYAAGFSQVKIRFGFNPEFLSGFTHYFWAVDDVLIFVNPIDYDLAANDMFLNDITVDYEYLRIPEVQANDQHFTVIVTNNGGLQQTGVHAVVTVFDPFGNNTTYSSDTISLAPGVRDTLFIVTDLIPDNIGLYNCNVNVMSDQNADDEFPGNNLISKSFNTTPNIMAHEHGTFFDVAKGSRPDPDNPGTFKEFALGSMFKMQTSAVLDGIQAQVVDSSSLGKTIYPVIYRVISGGIQGNVFPVSGYSVAAMLDGYSITEEDLNGEDFNIALSTTVTLDPDEYYMIALYTEADAQAVYYKAILDFDSDLSTIRFGLDQFGNDNWFNGYNYTPAIRLNFDISLNIIEKDEQISEVNTFPNPASEFVEIKFNTKSNEVVNITVYDMTGKRVLDKNLGNIPYGNQRVKLNVQGLNSGMYFYELRQGTSVVTNKFIVK
jgi:hypothetical protein